jgi:hypothetical protein
MVEFSEPNISQSIIKLQLPDMERQLNIKKEKCLGKLERSEKNREGTIVYEILVLRHFCGQDKLQ